MYSVRQVDSVTEVPTRQRTQRPCKFLKPWNPGPGTGTPGSLDQDPEALEALEALEAPETLEARKP